MDTKWKWHQIIHRLIDELNTTEKEVYKMNYISCLNWQGFLYEKHKVTEAINKNNKSTV